MYRFVKTRLRRSSFSRERIEAVPEIDEGLVKTLRLTQQEHFPVRVVEHIVDRPVAQSHEDTAEMTAALSVSAAKVNTGSVKIWFKGKGFGFIIPDAIANSWSALRSYNRKTRCPTIRNTTTARSSAWRSTPPSHPVVL